MSNLSEVYRVNLNKECLRRGWVSKKDPSFGSPSALVRELGRTSAFWSDRLHGRKPISTDLSYEIEEKLELSRLALAGEDGGDFVDVARVNVRLAAGGGSPPQLHEVIGHLKFARSFLRSCGVSVQGARVVDVKGSSMEPTIKDGAVLLVSTNNREPVDNQIFALVRPTEGLIVKRLVRQGGHWVARSDNRDHADFLIDDGEPITIIGRAIWMGAKL